MQLPKKPEHDATIKSLWILFSVLCAFMLLTGGESQYGYWFIGCTIGMDLTLFVRFYEMGQQDGYSRVTKYLARLDTDEIA